MRELLVLTLFCSLKLPPNLNYLQGKKISLLLSFSSIHSLLPKVFSVHLVPTTVSLSLQLSCRHVLRLKIVV